MPLDLAGGHQSWGRTGPSGLRAGLAAGTPCPGASFSSPPPPPAPRKGPTALPSRAQVRPFSEGRLAALGVSARGSVLSPSPRSHR
jgi:hypothetical protein